MPRLRNGIWYQTGGDVNPAAYGGVFCKADGRYTTCVEVNPTEETDIRGGPFVVVRINVDDVDLREFLKDKGAMESMDCPEEWTPDMRLTRALKFTIVEEFIRYKGASWGGDVTICSADGIPFRRVGGSYCRTGAVKFSAFREEERRWNAERREEKRRGR